MSTGTWYHVAATRTGGKIYLFLDGVLLGSGTANTETIFNGTSKLTVGALNEGADDFANGWIDEILLVDGTGLWSASFTPPTAAYA